MHFQPRGKSASNENDLSKHEDDLPITKKTFYFIFMHLRYSFLLLMGLLCSSLQAQQRTDIPMLPNEAWWGGATALGSAMPFSSLAPFNLSNQNANNQVSGMLISDQGRFIWSDNPFIFSVNNNSIHLDSRYEKVGVKQQGKTLRDAYLGVMRQHFPPNNKQPDALFFSNPQYNTWIELMYNQNQTDILNYARHIVDNGFPPGILMIDDNWQRYYGNFDFKEERFSNPRAMVDSLHDMGFKVMLWISPFVSADSPEYRALAKEGLLLRDATGNPAIIQWWNGQSACFDLTNPAALDYLEKTLRKMMHDYGIDGFKFDGGDNTFYDRADLRAFVHGARSVDQTKGWAELGCRFDFNEYRACWQMGNRPLVQRLGDKEYSWKAVQQLIPDMISAGLLGYGFACPDMIGGGSFASFLNIDADKFDQELIVRSAQVHTLMPMMQFSVAPWRILSAENLEIVRNMARLHVMKSPYITLCALESARTGEPIVRNLEYEFPHHGYANVKDQFMLGHQLMVAPMTTSGTSRTIILPPGRWRDDQGRVWRGNRVIKQQVPLSRLPYFERIHRQQKEQYIYDLSRLPYFKRIGK